MRISKNKPCKFRLALIISLTAIAVLCSIAIYICNTVIIRNADDKLYTSTENIPYNEVGLLLGTSPYLKNGNPNNYFNYRIDAATELYKSGKIKYILISGDNRKNDYNEPEEMKSRLIEAGVPPEAIYLDYAGFRTLDSVVRANKIFGQKKFTVISQKFHNERALYIAGKNYLDCIGYNAKDVTAYAGLKTRARELLARVKVFADIITDKQPHFLGEEIEIGN